MPPTKDTGILTVAAIREAKGRILFNEREQIFALPETQARGEILMAPDLGDKLEALGVAAFGQALDLGFEEAAVGRVGEAVASRFEPCNVLADLLDQGQMLGEGGEPFVGRLAHGVDRCSDGSDQDGIDRVGLRVDPDRRRKHANALRGDTMRSNAGLLERLTKLLSVPARGLEDDACWLSSAKHFDQASKTLVRVDGKGEGLLRRVKVNVDLAFSDVDPCKQTGCLLHLRLPW